MQAVRRRLRRKLGSPQGSLDRTYVCVCVYVFLYIYKCMRLGTKIIGEKTRYTIVLISSFWGC